MRKEDYKPEKGALHPATTTSGVVMTPSERATIEAARIKELRERLYSRGTAATGSVRHALPKHDTPHEAPHAIYDTIEKPPAQKVVFEEVVPEQLAPMTEEAVPVAPPGVSQQTHVQTTVQYTESMPVSKRRSSFRKMVALLGVAFFVVAVGVAAFLMFAGNNNISGNNISINVSGPITIGGGQELSFQVSIANQNTVPIQSATLIIEYPEGTQSAGDDSKELMVERRQLEVIGQGELVNVALKARLFGEENEQKEIRVSIDYRVEGSNATFHKEAEPLTVTVGTSPVVLTFDTVKTISSGQEVELKLTLQSNSPAPLENILVKTTYPDGFDFTTSKPDTVSGEDTWKFPVLKPGAKEVITIKGLVTGYENETRNFGASAGVANESSANTLASMLAKTNTEILIERPFLDVSVAVNGSMTDTVVINTDDVATVEINYKNVLDTAIYDGKVFVELSGNALNEFNVRVDNGFYDSNKNTITWDSVDETSLKEILPGRTSRLAFTLDPKSDIGNAPEMKLKVTVEGQRVFEDRAPQQLVGTELRTIKIESVPTIASSALYTDGPFTNTGPTPPVAGQVTQYTFTLKVKSGANDVTGAEVSAVVPQYVSWLDLVTEGDIVTYTTNTRTMKWTIGDMKANTEKEVSMQVSLLPSLSQVDTTPTILEAQRFKATDRFTGTVVRADHPALTTSLTKDSNEDLENGRVRAN